MSKIGSDIVRRFAVVLTIALYTIISASAQDNRQVLRYYLFNDTITMDSSRREKADVFYDSLKHRQYKSWISRTLTRLLIVGRSKSDASIPNTEMEIAQRYFGEFSGRTISAINVIQANVFEQRDPTTENWAERFVNSLHVLTSERQLRQNFLFEIGDKLNPYNMAINENLIRSLQYISTAFFVVVPDKQDSTKVTINVFARDNWSISAAADIGNASSVNAYDKNFLGLGNQLTLKYYYKQNHQADGFETTYNINNLMGTFANVELGVGVGATNNMLKIKANRPFILPSDHIFGFEAGYEQKNVGLSTFDTTLVINHGKYAAWYGYSLNIDPRQGTNLYYTVGGDLHKFNIRPEVNDTLNPYYHNSTSLLTSIGVARQNYFQGNMIYGYGRTEDVPYGYRFDLTGGVHWSEFMGRRYYASVSLSWAEMMKFGYVYAKVGTSTFYDQNRIYNQGMVMGDLRYFSPLWRLRRMYMRQFLNVSAIWGFNRLTGENEELGYTSSSNVRGVSTGENSRGYNRLTIGAESVVFSPIFFYHFRFAFNIWGDVGWMGYKHPMFDNPMSSAVGIGVRIRNERLIFNSLALRLGFALSLPENAKFNPFRITTEKTLDLERFTPASPQTMPYR